MSKLSFRAKALDASKPIPIYMAEELPDLPDYSVINRAVPQMPSGMEKEEECEHHLQRAICAGLIIPTPEVSDIADKNMYDKLYPANYKQPRQLIHMQPFTMEQDIPDYDMDSEDERWLDSQANRLDLNPLKFEEMMDQLEKSIGQTVVTLQDAKALLKEDDDLITAVFDYWLNKRLKLQHPLLLAVKTEHRAGTAMNNPYIAFRRRTEKMQTRKNRKNDETSYEKMLKLRRDLSRAVSLLEYIKKREKMKRELVQLTVEVFEKRYHAKDFAGIIAAEFMAQKTPRPAFTPIFQNNYPNHTWNNKTTIKEENLQRNPKRPYKKRKHKSLSHNRVGHAQGHSDGIGGVASSDDEMAPVPSPEPEEPEDEGMFAFRRNKNCSYHMPLATQGNWPWCSKEEHGTADKKYRYTLTSLGNPRRCIGFARRRYGRGGRVILDRLGGDINDFWRTMDFTVYDSTECAKETDTRTDNKSEPQEVAARTNSVSEVLSSASDVVIKHEPDLDALASGGGIASSQPVQPEIKLPTKEEHDEMLEILQNVRRDWLHFRPKTPPADYSPPCGLLPPDDLFTPSANTPFSLELQSLENTDMFTESSFVSAPFLLDYDLSMEVPVTDTRQLTNHLPPQSSTLTSVVDSGTKTDDEDAGRVGCSQFSVSDGASRALKRQDRAPSTFASPKLNSSMSLPPSSKTPAAAAITPTTPPTYAIADSAYDSSMSNANGIVSQFIEGGNRTRINKYDSFNHPYARPMGNSMPGGNNSAFRGLHTSAHAVTLNSHSTNILEIPMSGDAVADAVVSAKGQRETGATSPNSKAKTIARKNLVMEVT